MRTDHPLRTIRETANAALVALSGGFGRPVKALSLIPFHFVPSKLVNLQVISSDYESEGRTFESFRARQFP